jgi:hypothetical protein
MSEPELMRLIDEANARAQQHFIDLPKASRPDSSVSEKYGAEEVLRQRRLAEEMPKDRWQSYLHDQKTIKRCRQILLVLVVVNVIITALAVVLS